MIELVADHRVFFAEQRFEQATVGVEAARVKDRVVGAKKRAQAAFELLMHALRAADEADRCHAEAPLVEALFRRRDQARIVGKPEIVVGTEIQDFIAFAEPDRRRLRTLNDALGLVEAVGAKLTDNLVRVGAV